MSLLYLERHHNHIIYQMYLKQEQQQLDIFQEEEQVHLNKEDLLEKEKEELEGEVLEETHNKHQHHQHLKDWVIQEQLILEEEEVCHVIFNQVDQADQELL